MEGLLALSLFANACLLYYVNKITPENERKSYLHYKKIRDDEHRQLFYDYIASRYAGDSKKITEEQIKYYEIARAKKFFDN